MSFFAKKNQRWQQTCRFLKLKEIHLTKYQPFSNSKNKNEKK